MLLGTTPAPMVWCALPRRVQEAGDEYLGHRWGLPCVLPFVNRPRAAQRGGHRGFVACHPCGPACLHRGVLPCGVRACRWAPVGVVGPGTGSPSPLPLGCVRGPRGEATARLHFSTSPGWVDASAAWASPWFSPSCKAGRSRRLQLSVLWSFVSLFGFPFFL